MRMSRLFGKTLRQAPATAETPSHRLLSQAGLVQQLASGVYSYLPIGWRALRKVEQIIREESDAVGGHELRMPTLHPAELWEESGRREAMGEIMFGLRDRRQRELVLGPTHEEIIVGLYKSVVQSYRDLPVMPYQIQTKFRDEPRPRGGLIRLREFAMHDLYSFDADWEGLDVSYQKMWQCYKNIFDRCGVPTVTVEADSGAIGGKESQEFMCLTDAGEDEALICPGCGYAANAEKAGFQKRRLEPEELLPLEEVSTPGVTAIDDLARFLDVPPWKTLKSVFYMADGRPVFVAIRGELAVNETKLRNALGASDLHLMDAVEAREAGLEAGFASPIGLKNAYVVADDSAPGSPNLVAGANKPDTHLRNVTYDRDWKADIVTDVALARGGEPCPNCGRELEIKRGIEVGHIFKLGTFYSEKLDATYLAADGSTKPAIMGTYGIGLERLLATIIEANHDEKGIIWPSSVAPYQVHLVALNIEQPEVKETAERLYADLQAGGVEVLYDDREESPGVKFNDADLLGMPLRVTVSPRTREKGSVELKRRAEKETSLAPLAEAAASIADAVKS